VDREEIRPVHADAQEVCMDIEFPQEPGALLKNRDLFVRPIRRIRQSNADGKRLYRCKMAAAGHGHSLPLDTGFKSAIHGIEKVPAMRLNVKADQIRAQQTVEQFMLPRADSERFRIRPGNVPEDRDPGIGPPFLDQAR